MSVGITLFSIESDFQSAVYAAYCRRRARHFQRLDKELVRLVPSTLLQISVQPQTATEGQAVQAMRKAVSSEQPIGSAGTSSPTHLILVAAVL